MKPTAANEFPYSLFNLSHHCFSYCPCCLATSQPSERICVFFQRGGGMRSSLQGRGESESAKDCVKHPLPLQSLVCQQTTGHRNFASRVQTHTVPHFFAVTFSLIMSLNIQHFSMSHIFRIAICSKFTNWIIFSLCELIQISCNNVQLLKLYEKQLYIYIYIYIYNSYIFLN